MRKYRGFVGEVSTLGQMTPRPGYQFTFPELYADPSYRGAIQQSRIPGYVAPVPVAVASPVPLYIPPPVIQVPPSPPPVVVEPVVVEPVVETLPPPVPGTGPVDLMEPDTYTDDYNVVAPVSIGPTAGRGAGPAGSLGPEGAGNGAETRPGNNALFWAAVAATLILGG